MTPALDVAVGVLSDADGRLLIARRRAGTPGAGCWEFPGGKQEPGESMRACLARELSEEIGVTDPVTTPLIRFVHERGARPVRVHVWRVHAWMGEAGGREGQEVAWVSRAQLGGYELLPATDVILAALDMPRRYLITPGFHGSHPADWFAALDAALASGVRLLRLRDEALADAAYAELAAPVIARAQARGAAVLLDRDADMVVALNANGLHWSAARVAAAQHRPLAAGYWFGASAHDGPELDAAIARGADFATLSPVTATASHPSEPPLGWPGFEARRGDRALPVYALGGLDAGDELDALEHNAQGIAAIRGLWGGSCRPL